MQLLFIRFVAPTLVLLFSAVSAVDVHAAHDPAEMKQELNQAIARLDQFLGDDGLGQRWRTYLIWETLNEQLTAPEPALPRLDRIHARLSQTHPDLTRSIFSDVRVKLKNYIRAVKAQRDLRRQTTKPSVLISISGDVISAGFEQDLDVNRPITDVILGTRITGDGRTRGNISVSLVPDDDSAVFDLNFSGTTTSKTVGRNGPVTICSNGKTNIQARKRFTISHRGIRLARTTASARTNSTVTGLSTGMGGLLDWIVRKIAWRRIGSSKAEGDRIAARHAERDFSRTFDSETKDRLRAAHSPIMKNVGSLIAQRDGTLFDFAFRTTDHGGTISFLPITPTTDMQPAPVFLGGRDMGFRLHESAANSAFARLLAGRTITEKKIRQQISEFLGRAADDLPQLPVEDIEITFAKDAPVTLKMHDDRLLLRARILKLIASGVTYPPTDVVVHCRVQRVEGGVRAKVFGELDVMPFSGGEAGDASGGLPFPKDVRLRLRNILENEFFLTAFVLPGPWKKLGEIEISQATTNDGWLAIAFTRRSTVADAPVAAPQVASFIRVWTDHTGTRQAHAALLRVSGEIAHFRLDDGNQVTRHLDRLSEKDQRLIREWVDARPVNVAQSP